MKICNNCNTKWSDNTTVCGNCGLPLSTINVSPEEDRSATKVSRKLAILSIISYVLFGIAFLLFVICMFRAIGGNDEMTVPMLICVPVAISTYISGLLLSALSDMYERIYVIYSKMGS